MTFVTTSVTLNVVVVLTPWRCSQDLEVSITNKSPSDELRKVMEKFFLKFDTEAEVSF